MCVLCSGLVEWLKDVIWDPFRLLTSSDGCQLFNGHGTYSCRGSNITYTCVLNTSADTVVTLWSGSAFQCPPTNQISLLQRSGRIVQPFHSGSCGSLSAVTTNVTSSCYTSVLTIPADQALDGTTVLCEDAFSGAVVGSDTVIVASELKQISSIVP